METHWLICKITLDDWLANIYKLNVRFQLEFSACDLKCIAFAKAVGFKYIQYVGHTCTFNVISTWFFCWLQCKNKHFIIEHNLVSLLFSYNLFLRLYYIPQILRFSQNVWKIYRRLNEELLKNLRWYCNRHAQPTPTRKLRRVNTAKGKAIFQRIL